MTKLTADSVLDGPAGVVRSNIVQAHVVSGDPANLAGLTGTILATAAYAAGDVVSANGDTSGRKMTFAAKSSVSISQSGLAAHIVYVSGSEILMKTELQTPVSLTAGGTIDIPALDAEFADPT